MSAPVNVAVPANCGDPQQVRQFAVGVVLALRNLSGGGGPIFSLPWGAISGTPTTFAGYGIVDRVVGFILLGGSAGTTYGAAFSFQGGNASTAGFDGLIDCGGALQ